MWSRAVVAVWTGAQQAPEQASAVVPSIWGEEVGTWSGLMGQLVAAAAELEELVVQEVLEEQRVREVQEVLVALEELAVAQVVVGRC